MKLRSDYFWSCKRTKKETSKYGHLKKKERKKERKKLMGIKRKSEGKRERTWR